MDTATVAVITSSTVAVASIGANLLQHERGLKVQRKLADFENVRGVLDDAAAELHRVAYVLDDVRSRVTQHGVGFFKSDDGTATFTELGRLGRELDALTARLSVRFGRGHEVVALFSAANHATLEIYQAAGLVRLEPEPDGSPAAAHSVRKFYDETRDKIEAQRSLFDDARERFLDAAHRTAGAQLPSRKG